MADIRATRLFGKDDRPVPDHPAGFTEHRRSRIRIADHGSPPRSQLPGRDHRRQHRSLAAGAGRQPRKPLLHLPGDRRRNRGRVQRGDRLQHLPIHFHRVLVLRVVRQIRRSHDQRPAICEHSGQGFAESLCQIRIRLADHRSHDLGLGENHLRERHLHLDRMLAFVHLGPKREGWIRRDQFRSQFPVDLRHPQRRAVPIALVHRYSVEPRRRVVGPQDDDQVVGELHGQAIPVRRDLPRVHVSRVRHHQRHWPSPSWWQRVFQKTLDRSLQLDRITRIKPVGHGRLAHLPYLGFGLYLRFGLHLGFGLYRGFGLHLGFSRAGHQKAAARTQPPQSHSNAVFHDSSSTADPRKCRSTIRELPNLQKRWTSHPNAHSIR